METDLTPTEARAEVEAFMGEGWRGTAWKEGDAHFVGAYPGHAAQWTLRSRESLTYRAAVEALKQSWRDAVRPWMEEAIEAKLDTADVDGYAPTDDVISRVLKESDHEA